MAKRPTVTSITSGYSSAAQLNTNLTNIQEAFDNTLSLDGSTPNSMGADLDLNSNDLLNVGSITMTGSFTMDGTSVVPTGLSSFTELTVPGTLTLGGAVSGDITMTYPDRIAIVTDGSTANDPGKAIHIRQKSGEAGDDLSNDSLVYARKHFESVASPSGTAHNIQLQTIQESYNRQNVWGLSHSHTQKSPLGSANAVNLTIRGVRELEYTSGSFQIGTTGDYIDGQMWGVHAPLKDTIKYDDFVDITDVSPMVNEWSMGCWNADSPTNRPLKTIAQAQAGVTKNAVANLGYLGKRAMHTMTAYGWDSASEVGVGILIKTSTQGGGDGDRSFTDPATGTEYIDDYGSFRYGIAIDDHTGRASGNPGIIGVGLYISSGGQSNIELYGDSDRGLWVHGEYVSDAIRVAGTAAKGINVAGGTFTNDKAISMGDDHRLTLSDDDTKYMRWNSALNRVEFIDTGTVRGYVDMATGSGVKMN